MGVSWANWTYKVKQNYGNWGFFTSNYNPSPDLNNDSTATIIAKWSKFGTANFVPNTTFQALIQKYSGNTPPPPPSASFALKAVANGSFVCADNAGASPLIANRAAVGGAWETYKVIDNADGTIALQSMANNLYVCADLNQSAKLIARSTSIQLWEEFKKVTQADGTVALIAMANNQYVCCDLNLGAVLYANRPAYGGAWESFNLLNQ